jgi:hypothetical protein
MKLGKLFKIADAAKNIGDYETADRCFAVIAFCAVMAQKHNIILADEAQDVRFVYEYDETDDDWSLIDTDDDWSLNDSLFDPSGIGYYDLVAVALQGQKLLGGEKEELYLCIPLPLLSRWFLNRLAEQGEEKLKLIPRRGHRRRRWRLTRERREAASRELRRRLQEEAWKVSRLACPLVLYNARGGGGDGKKRRSFVC